MHPMYPLGVCITLLIDLTQNGLWSGVCDQVGSGVNTYVIGQSIKICVLTNPAEHLYVRWHSKQGLMRIPRFEDWGKHKARTNDANNTFKVRTFFCASLNMTSTNKARKWPIPNLYPLHGECYPVHLVTKQGLAFCAMSKCPHFECGNLHFFSLWMPQWMHNYIHS